MQIPAALTASGTNLVCTLQAGSKVKILKRSHKQSIVSLNSFWVYVEIMKNTVTTDGKILQKETNGYCFSGYLE